MFQIAERVADAVLWEGYVLYPYRASATKNRYRWQFGVLVPREYSEWGSEPWSMRTECLIDPTESTSLDIKVRYLQVQARTVEEILAGADEFRPVQRLSVEGRELVTWEEGHERSTDFNDVKLADLLRAERIIPILADAGREVETVRDAAGESRARLVRERSALMGRLRVSAVTDGSLIRLRVLVENVTPWPEAVAFDRPIALRHSLIGAHTLLAIRDGAFVSLLEPPESAAAAAAACANEHTYPVLVGEPGSRSVILSSPILLYDYPEVAPESPGDLFDATEIDEILTLRIQTLTDAEKVEARATDERARQVIDRSEALPPEIMERLHGAIRSLAPAADSSAPEPG